MSDPKTNIIQEQPQPRILFVDDEPENCTVFRYGFEEFAIDTLTDPTEALEQLRNGSYGVLVTDQRMPNMSGLSLAVTAKEANPLLVVVMVTAYTDRDLLLDALNRGVLFRFIPKPWDHDKMEAALRDACAQHQAVKMADDARQAQARQSVHRRELQARIANTDEHWDFADPAMHTLIQQLDQVAASEATVLLYGASGTGKELFAKRIHRTSTRCDGPFVAVNCGALPDTLVESELFGHVKGAFTGADRQRNGRFALAEGGTLFLDEIGELPLAAQATLLRVLQERIFHPVGGEKEVAADCRIVAATHRDLRHAIESGTFREDLFWRLAQFELNIPSLDERTKEDKLGWIDFLRIHCANTLRVEPIQFSETTQQQLLNQRWPGNIRQLSIEIQRIYLIGEAAWQTGFNAHTTSVDQTAANLGHTTVSNEVDTKSTVAPASASTQQSLKHSVADLEQQQIIDALVRSNFHPADAARILGLKRPTLYYRMRKYGINLDDLRKELELQ